MFASVEQAWDLGAAGIGATIYFGSENCRRQIMEISEAFQQAHELGMFTVLWCYLRNPAFKHEGTDYHASADLTGQANHLGVTIEADIIKQKQPTNNGGYPAIGFGKTHQLVYEKLVPDHPIELTRWQVVNCYMGRVGLINSGGASGDNDLAAGGRDRGHQQAGRRHGPDLRPQGLPEAHEGRRHAAQRDPGRVPLRGRHHRLSIILDRLLRFEFRISNFEFSRASVSRWPGAALGRSGSQRPKDQMSGWPCRPVRWTRPCLTGIRRAVESR